jgi:hemerythrin
MDSFTWKESFNTGIPEIDRQHQSFLDCLNDCGTWLLEGKRGPDATELIGRLKAYAAMHFRFEEHYMEVHNYPGLEQQRRMHEYFETQVAELEASLSRPDARSLERFIPFLRDWLLTHILEQDKRILSL